VAKESRIGKYPVPVPQGVTYTLKDNHLAVKGPKGELAFQFPPTMVMTEEEGAIKLAKADESKKAREGHGLYRTLCNNMMVGVSTGFEKKLKLVGVGYKAAMQGKDLNLALGYAHPVILEVPEGLKVECTSNTDIVVSGYDKVEVGNFAAIIRSKRKPEPYKGKGVRYADEVVIIKEGKRK
jgi:large subunit ribosomal protein L6